MRLVLPRPISLHVVCLQAVVKAVKLIFPNATVETLNFIPNPNDPCHNNNLGSSASAGDMEKMMTAVTVGKQKVEDALESALAELVAGVEVAKAGGVEPD